MMQISRKRGEKRGQVAIFVIVAIVIVIVILAIFLFPKLKSSFSSGEINPSSYLSSCITPELRNGVALLAKQGGTSVFSSGDFAVWNGNKIKYLCYTSEYYKTCVVQQPMLVSHFKEQLSNLIEPTANSCFNKLKQDLVAQGYSVSNTKNDVVVDLDTSKINVNFNSPIILTKGATTKTYNSFNIALPSKMYNLLSLAQSIVEYENTYGDSETTVYLQYYPDLSMNKIRESEGTKIYILSDVTSKENFTFATRSLAWPPGYGLG